MLRRKMLDYLQKWKDCHKAECLLVNGARQVGKSFIISHFGRNGKKVTLPLYMAMFLRRPAFGSIG